MTFCHVFKGPVTWQGCYDQQWTGLITPESFPHPAKMARGLLERIIRHGLDRGYWSAGQTIGDCFGGVGTTGIVGAYHGLRVISVELEKRFVSMARRNYALHTSKWKRLGVPRPVILQGDSRRFDEIVGPVVAMLSSPPFLTARSDTTNPSGGIMTTGYGDGGEDKVGDRTYRGNDGDRTPGNIETLPCGELAAVLSSPPYSDSLRGGDKDGIDWDKAIEAGRDRGKHEKGSSASGDYPKSPGQIGALKAGDLQAVVSSPPWQENCEGGRPASKFPAHKQILNNNRGHGASDAAVLAQAARDEQKVYGDSPGQIGRENGESYWQAMALVYAACFRDIRPEGVLVLVTKDYVKNRKRVPLSDDTVTLCEHTGFKLMERARAMLVSETRHADLFDGEDVKTKSRKSFFRRLAEKNGSPSIDWEDVLVFRRP